MKACSGEQWVLEYSTAVIGSLRGSLAELQSRIEQLVQESGKSDVREHAFSAVDRPAADRT